MIHQREIKFRAWDINTKKMFDPHFKIEKPGDSYSLNDVLMDYGEPSGHILMQFTGLRALKGEEIFEGDIIQDVNGHLGEVIFHRGCFCTKTGDKEYHLFNESDHIIVGNVYENPTLLK